MPYYDDAGTEFDPKQLPIPELCLKCQKNNIPDGDEEILCNLTRADQIGEKDFQCHAFQAIAEK
jgi:hypothetical protein